MEKLLDIKAISLSFGGIKAVKQVSLELHQNEIVGLIGPNGAGKTTIFNILTGVYKPDEGTILYKNEEIHHLRPQEIVKRGISRTFQNIRLFGDLRVVENVMVGMHIRTGYTLVDSTFRTPKYRKQEEENLAKAMDILDMLGLLDQMNEYALNLPYGDQRKVEIARAIATGAEILLLDEPAAGMNPQESADLMRFIQSLKGLGFTVLIIEHDMSVVMNVSDRVYVLDNGELIAKGTPQEVANNDRVIKAYLGGELHA